MLRVFGLALAAGIATLGAAQAAGDAAYVDDRSSPARLVESLYNAIGRQEYARAWSYFAEPPVPTLEAYASGFKDTAGVRARVGAVSSEGAAGSAYYNVPVAIEATGKDGGVQVFAGCYEMRLANPQVQAAEFSPLRIVKGSLKRATVAFDAAVPPKCGDGPAPAPVDAALEKATAMVALAYQDRCGLAAAPGNEKPAPEIFEINYHNTTDAEDATESKARLMRFFCDRGAYNESHVFALAASDGTVRLLAFAQPSLDIRYENDNSEGKVEDVNVIGFEDTAELVNSDYDASTRTMTSYAKWRGVGDASTSGTWIFRDGNFSLVKFDVDASYDGEINPETVVDYNTGP